MHAARVLTRVAPERARSELVGQLAEETEPRVRLAILDGLGSLGEGSFGEPELGLAERLLQSETPAERAAVIDWIGRSADEATRRQVLGRHFRAESDARLRQHIGTYVSAADLRTAG